MNFIGHIEVARIVAADRAPTPGFLLGAALPDLAAMGRFRLLARPTDPEVAAGIDLHHRTDDAFHRHPTFRSTSGAAAAALSRDGLTRGAARACGHVGVELLLDGHLLADRAALRPAVEAAIETAGRRADELADLVEPDRRPEWRRHLDRLARWPVPEDYHLPDAVAERLQRILSRRPRLRFAPSEIETVARGLEEQRHAVAGGATRLLDDLDRELAPGP